MKKLFSRIDLFWYKFNDVLTVYTPVFNFTVDLNKDINYSCSIQLTNKTDLLVVIYFGRKFWRGSWAPPGDDTLYVGTILPWSTRSVTVTGKRTKEWIYIYAYVANDGVKAEDITRENFLGKTTPTRYRIGVPVKDYYNRFLAANSCSACSAVPKKKGKGISLLDDHNNVILHQPISDEVYGTTSKGKGSKSSVRSQSYNETSSIILFSDDDIKGATNGLSDCSKIGHGGYGTVYKGNLHDTEVAIKMLDSSSKQGIAEFLQEMEVLGRMRHPNLVKLIGACVKLRALVYEFLPHGSVEDYLKENPRLLTWQMRTRIVYDICSALTFLHSIKPEPVVHGDLKPANILLDANFISKLADFGLCRFLPGGTATVAYLKTKNIQGTEWYIDPDFLETGKLTAGCDVYSFGITMLRILTGAPAARVYRKVVRAIREKSLMATVDSAAGGWPENVAEYLARMGLECCEPERKNSKLMKEISTGLEDILAKI
ncbi:putative U-box domain-containing protein 33 isoform X1 [Iris pallida]|uniref:RING-type E3 ubiquitin transferase n=1 Tax=Iris pallida TaxID=29817 RepID=A0AAX6GPB5_IRIPA|nr:putative U-box domain-containing protein 33 isoform X1 [Iris pallida]